MDKTAFIYKLGNLPVTLIDTTRSRFSLSCISQPVRLVQHSPRFNTTSMFNSSNHLNTTQHNSTQRSSTPAQLSCSAAQHQHSSAAFSSLPLQRNSHPTSTSQVSYVARSLRALPSWSRQRRGFSIVVANPIISALWMNVYDWSGVTSDLHRPWLARRMPLTPVGVFHRFGERVWLVTLSCENDEFRR